jgi:hypothetical protein
VGKGPGLKWGGRRYHVITDGINQSRTGSFRAVVRAGADETVYQRAGAGRPIVALSTRTLDDGAWSAVITGLATRFRVIVPLVDPGRADFSGGLRRFLDGDRAHQRGAPGR